ncbi:MAG: hypothetical protein MHMPM18_000778 [Marteilia pararefringens]
MQGFKKFTSVSKINKKSMNRAPKNVRMQKTKNCSVKSKLSKNRFTTMINQKNEKEILLKAKNFEKDNIKILK